jgi:prepilin-type N-terminal cleavage/methylation domain-containing protein
MIGSKRRGITLLELLIASAIGVIVSLGAAFAFSAAVSYQSQSGQKRADVQAVQQAEDRIANLLSLATLSSDNSSPNSYFVGEQAGGTQSNESANSLTFVVLGDRVRGNLLESTDTFENLNQTFGPQGGLMEVQLGAEAIGESRNSNGTLIRTQRPADGDRTQGGNQQVLSPDMTNMVFEFYDGEAWQVGWDTQAEDEPRLPAAVRVTYTWKDESQRRTFTVRLPNSDVTPDSPAVSTGGAA